MFTLSKNIIRSSQELDVADLQARLFEHLARGCVGEGLAVFLVAAWTLQSA